MNYASIREMDISNGESIGVALFVQGCHFHCHNCFNQETWDFNGGNEWNDEIKDKFLELINRPYIKRITILGGEPLANESVENILDLVSEIRVLFPDKSIWIYTGYTFEEIQLLSKGLDQESMRFNKYNKMRQNILENCDVLVDGRYIDELRDITLKWRGSSNQRVIDVKKIVKTRKSNFMGKSIIKRKILYIMQESFLQLAYSMYAN